MYRSFFLTYAMFILSYTQLAILFIWLLQILTWPIVGQPGETVLHLLCFRNLKIKKVKFSACLSIFLHVQKYLLSVGLPYHPYVQDL